jgi:excisionase family DNA binding protein
LLLEFRTHDHLLTVAEAARRLRLSRATVYKLVAEGRLAHVRLGNAIRFLPGAVGVGAGARPRVP